jgi:hypothetical protein
MHRDATANILVQLLDVAPMDRLAQANGLVQQYIGSAVPEIQEAEPVVQQTCAINAQGVALSFALELQKDIVTWPNGKSTYQPDRITELTHRLTWACEVAHRLLAGGFSQENMRGIDTAIDQLLAALPEVDQEMIGQYQELQLSAVGLMIGKFLATPEEQVLLLQWAVEDCQRFLAFAKEHAC